MPLEYHINHDDITSYLFRGISVYLFNEKRSGIKKQQLVYF